MKRTCKTCVYFDAYGNCWNPKGTPLCLDLPQSRKSNDPACTAWVLAPGKLTTAFRASLDKAREKHPVFLDAWPKAEDAETYLDTAEIHKLGIGKKDSDQLHSILFSEVFEFLAEVARGGVGAGRGAPAVGAGWRLRGYRRWLGSRGGRRR